MPGMCLARTPSMVGPTMLPELCSPPARKQPMAPYQLEWPPLHILPDRPWTMAIFFLNGFNPAMDACRVRS